MSYKVKLAVFEGPFDLLVYLIERSGVNIYDVNIAEITEQYIRYVEAMQSIDPDSAAEFMVLAATLIHIKSRLLLPSAKKESGTADEDAEEDPRDELAAKLEEYKKVRALAELLRKKEKHGAAIYTKPREDISAYLNAPVEHLEMDMDQFIRTFQKFLERRLRIVDIKKRYQQIDRERMTMEKKSGFIMQKLRQKTTLSLEELFAEDADLYEIVLTFVTVLEMLKNGMLFAEQTRNFERITIRSNPSYLEKEAAESAEKNDDGWEKSDG